MSTNLLTYLRSLYQATGEFTAYSKALNIEKIGVFLLTILFLLIIRSDNYMVYIGIQILVGIIVTIYLLIKLEGRLHFLGMGNLSFKEVKDNTRAGFVLMLGNFSSGVFTGLDRWFVKVLMGSVSFALYSFASSLLNLLNVFITPITVSLYNYFCKGIENQKIKDLKQIVLAWGLLLISAAYPVEWIIINFLKKYEGALLTIYVLFAAQIFIAVIQGIYVNLYKARHLQKKYLLQMIIMLFIGTVTNALFYLIYPQIESFAYATLVTYFIWFVSCEYKYVSLRYDSKDYIAIGVLLGGYFLFIIWLNPVLGLCLYAILYLGITRLFMPKVWSFVYSCLKSFIGNEYKR